MSDPKKSFGESKPNLALIPPVALAHAAMNMEDGAEKYGPYNWRKTKVEAMTYIAAIKRHIDAYLDGEDLTSDTGLENLGAVIAGASILLDAREQGSLIDNRPTKGKATEVQDRLKAQKQARLDARKAAEKPVDLNHDNSGMFRRYR